ncbi:3-deoxy-D-manno-octulosonic acid transferase [Flavobacterium cerinum]|uniref:3-deoxy-D-manno-octulosonic acid transferase n=1 Tax=Flavobacterium cerinum TaxID=2502784 RepID=A0ABY5IVU3_9FLAO|nr:glycosyltransferase N-terminal domain-containing protein [Flavobacterium cerinum]UUC46784.1 3-deoxy-D-manno-octulosonic acid transferase [Flavobacterium cerinum]
MFFLYDLLVRIAGFLIRLIALISPKIKLFTEGRKTVFSTLESAIHPTDKTIWFHSASLGEYEQGLPVMEKIKAHYPTHKIVLTFFSPSGYEVRKNNPIADVTVYLPLDTRKNAKRFIASVHPDLAFFIKYEYWPNYLDLLHQQQIPTYLVSGIFREKQSFFKWYGSFYRNALKSFRYFFVQNEKSKQLLHSIGFTNVKITGDTRFDRVAAILERDNTLDYIENFKNETTTIVIGSSWPKDESLLVNYINQCTDNVKFIIAPHNIKPDQIQELKKSITRKVVLYSEKEQATDLSSYTVFIIDTIGILTKIYSYADIAYVGGGFGKPGVHNILEPATFGIPIVIGPNFSHFAEAIALVNMEGCISISNQKELNEAFSNLIQNDDIRYEKGHICSTFVQMNQNATNSIVNHIKNEYPV